MGVRISGKIPASSLRASLNEVLRRIDDISQIMSVNYDIQRYEDRQTKLSRTVPVVADLIVLPSNLTGWN